MNRWTSLLFLLGFLALMGFLCARILAPMIEPLAWAIILSYALWPLYYRLNRLMGNRRGLSAALMVFLIGSAIVIPLIVTTAVLQKELVEFIQQLPAWEEGKPGLQARLLGIPLIGESLNHFIEPFEDIHDVLTTHLLPRLRDVSHNLIGMLQDAGFILLKWVLSLFLMFFLFRGGDRLVAEIHQGMRHGLGERVDAYFATLEETTKAVVYGIVLTAIVQGAFAGIGYWFVSMPSPVLLTIATMAMAIIPFGASVVWLLASLWLFMHGQIWPCTMLLGWGFVVVSWVDNLVRPVFISQNTRIPFVVVLLGILGGLMSFGIIGLFIGPVILAIALALWEEWLESTQGRTR